MKETGRAAGSGSGYEVALEFRNTATRIRPDLGSLPPPSAPEVWIQVVQEQYLTTSLILRPRPRLQCLLGNKAALIGSGPVPPSEGGYDGWNAATVPHSVNAAGSTPRPVCSPAPAFITHSDSSNSNLLQSDEAQKVPITKQNSSAVRVFSLVTADVTRTLRCQR